MGNKQLAMLADVDPTALPVYTVGLSGDLTFESQHPNTQKVISRLKAYDPKQMFKYRTRDKETMMELGRHAEGVIVLQDYNIKLNSLAIMRVGNSCPLKLRTISTVLRNELKLSEAESLFIYVNGRLCPKDGEVKLVPNDQDGLQITRLKYSKTEVFGGE